MRKYDDQAVISRLQQYGIGEDDYEVEMNVYHSEERRGVPYLTLLINKVLPTRSRRTWRWSSTGSTRPCVSSSKDRRR